MKDYSKVKFSEEALSRRDSMRSNEKEFFRIAKKMNERFAFIPLLFGSIALNMQVEEEVWTGDIDIAVPHLYCPDRATLCYDLIIMMEALGYELVDYWEGEFQDIKNNIMVHIIGDNGFMEYAGIDITKCPILQTDGAIYKRFTLEHLFKSYDKSKLEYGEEYHHEKCEFARKAFMRTE
ncbi:MAG: hypothetical protein FWG63_00535 [Defluviitaleaceae bacterium]|nr:hypothetical protein [Defluviitaleaceae bacterium]